MKEHINFYENNFSIANNGELEFNGEVICIKDDFRYSSIKQKKAALISLINWANETLDDLNKKSQYIVLAFFILFIKILLNIIDITYIKPY